jgi:hypothetical protein
VFAKRSPSASIARTSSFQPGMMPGFVLAGAGWLITGRNPSPDVTGFPDGLLTSFWIRYYFGFIRYIDIFFDNTILALPARFEYYFGCFDICH